MVYEVGEESASFTAAYEDFFVGNIKINGTRNFAIIGNVGESSIDFSVTSNLTVEMEDGSTISETGTKTMGFAFSEEMQGTVFTLSGSWTVQANGNTYVVETNDSLEGTLGCLHLTAGSMNVSKNGLAVTIDFGDGECDDKATLIYPNGATKEITL